MRERGFDPATCDQIEQLASSILSAAALRNPDDDRAQKLADVLGYLERRIDAMLASVAGVEAIPDSEAALHPPSPALVDTAPVEHVDPTPEAAAATAPDIGIETMPLAVQPMGAVVESVATPAAEHEPDSAPAAVIDVPAEIVAEPAPQDIPHPIAPVAVEIPQPTAIAPVTSANMVPPASAGEPNITPSLAPAPAPRPVTPVATIDLVIEHALPARSQDTAHASADFLDLDDLVPPNEFGLAAPAAAEVSERAKPIAVADAAAPGAADAIDVAATPVATTAPSVSATAAYDVSPVEFASDTDERIETPAADVQPDPPSAPQASAPARHDLLAIAGMPVDVLREIEQELFVVEVAAPPEPAPAERAEVPRDPPQPAIAELRPAANARSQPTQDDPLAALKALSDEERIALFT